MIISWYFLLFFFNSSDEGKIKTLLLSCFSFYFPSCFVHFFFFNFSLHFFCIFLSHTIGIKYFLRKFLQKNTAPARQIYHHVRTRILFLRFFLPLEWLRFATFGFIFQKIRFFWIFVKMKFRNFWTLHSNKLNVGFGDLQRKFKAKSMTFSGFHFYLNPISVHSNRNHEQKRKKCKKIQNFFWILKRNVQIATTLFIFLFFLIFFIS